MGDMGDYFRETKEFRKELSKNKKDGNYKSSCAMLDRNGMEYEEKGYPHLVVKHNGKVADFWPTTGKFSIRGSGQYRRGVRLLIKLLKQTSKEQIR